MVLQCGQLLYLLLGCYDVARTSHKSSHRVDQIDHLRLDARTVLHTAAKSRLILSRAPSNCSIVSLRLVV